LTNQERRLSGVPRATVLQAESPQNAKNFSVLNEHL
jgi:hypothetical protein